MTSNLWRTGLFALLVACASCSGKKDESGAASTGSRPAEPVKVEAPKSSEEAKDSIEDTVDQIVAQAAKLPREEFEPASLASSLGKNPNAHFDWVRDHTSWAPYRGLLRGPQGVMLDRVGSNLDRAVLLGDLLRRAGHTVRLARAQLSESQAREVLGKLRPMPERKMPSGPDESIANARKLVQSQTDAVMLAIREAASASADDENRALAALRDHWWVEREDNGDWVAMDVLRPDARMGEALVQASSKSNWKMQDAAPSIPDADWHSVQMRIVVERYEAGETKEFTVLETDIHPAEVFDRPVTLLHAPVPWPENLTDPDADPQPFRDAAIAVKVWVPALLVGGRQIVQSAFTSEGDLKANAAEDPGALAKVGGIEVASGMEMALGGFGPEQVVPAATAEWIDYEIRAPGVENRRFRRQVFDLLGPARRASKSPDFNGTESLRKLERFEALWSQTDVMLQPCEFTGEYVAHILSAGVVTNQVALKEIASEKDPAKARKLAGEILEHLDVWGPLPNLVRWRSVLDDQSVGAYIDQVNVLQYRVGRSVVNAGPAKYDELVDIASNPSGARRGTSKNAFEVQVRQGVTDTVAEMLAVGNDLGMANNTASMFDRLTAEKSRGMLIQANDDAAVRALPWPEDEMARVARDVNAGYIVVVPRQAVLIDGQQHVGWWRVDPRTGETVGVMDNGYHTTLTSKVVTIVTVLGPILNNPMIQQRLQRISHIAQNLGGRGLSVADMNLYNANLMYNRLFGGLEWLARRP